MGSAFARFADSSLGRILKLASEDNIQPRLQASPKWREQWAQLLRQPGAPRLPFYHRAGYVALLDDDPSFLEMLQLAVPRSWETRAYLSADACVNALQQEPPLWEAEMWAQQEMVAQWHQGLPIIPLVLRHWATRAGLSLARVLVADYYMPGKTGLDALSELVDWPGGRVLLSGAFEESVVTGAFNSGQIDHYLPKQEVGFLGRLILTVESLRCLPDERFHQIWMGTLSQEQAALLRGEGVMEDLVPYLFENFREWVLLGDPFGVLGLDAAGTAHWLQLEPRAHLDELAHLSTSYGLPAEAAARIRDGALLSNVQLRQALSAPGAGTVSAHSLGDEGELLVGQTAIHVTGNLSDRNLRALVTTTTW